MAISLLFSTELYHEAVDAGTDIRRLKTCFVDSFEFNQVHRQLNDEEEVTDDSLKTDLDNISGLLNVPLREFIAYVPQDKMAYYKGSETEPPCSETVTWIVNMTPHVITSEQVS